MSAQLTDIGVLPARHSRGVMWRSWIMKEILFRGKRVDNGEWIEGSLITNVFRRLDKGDIPYILNAEKANYDSWSDFDEGNGIYEIASESVEQYTGLTDKNGKKIFEGNIVVYCINSRRHRGIIKYDIETCSFRCYEKRFKNEYETKAHINASDYLSFDYVEAVIGNIHDNPKLLEETGQWKQLMNRSNARKRY